LCQVHHTRTGFTQVYVKIASNGNSKLAGKSSTNSCSHPNEHPNKL
jgi:hypothetical protein